MRILTLLLALPVILSAETPKDPNVTSYEIPDYTLEFERTDSRVVENRHRVLNVRDFGAVADGEPHPLREKFADQEAIDKEYGAGRYTLTDQMDFVAIMEAIRTAKAAANKILKRSVVGANTVYLPQGIYMINRTIPLVDIRGGTVRGDGKDQTVLRFTGKEQALFGLQRSTKIGLSGMTLESHLSNGATAIHVADTLTQYPGRPTFHFDFTEIYVDGFDTGILTTGSHMTDSLNFINCMFRNFRRGVHLNNHQSMGHHFVNCYFGFATANLPLLPEGDFPVAFYVNQGGNITMTGGYVILHDGVTLLLDPKNDRLSYSPLNWSTALFNFYGVRWEQVRRNQPVLFEAKTGGKFDESYVARINFDNCVLYQRTEAEGGEVGRLRSGMNVTFRNCMANKNGAVIQEIIDPKQNTGRRAVLILDNTSGFRFSKDASPDVLYHHAVEVRGPEAVLDPTQ